MTQLGDRFKNVRTGLDNYVIPTGTADKTDSLSFNQGNYYQNIEGKYVPGKSINVPFTARPMVNLIKSNIFSPNDTSFAPILDTFYGRPIYRSGNSFDGKFDSLFLSNPIYKSPLIKKAYFNFFVKNGNGKTLAIDFRYYGSSSEFRDSYRFPVISINGNATQFISVPISLVANNDSSNFNSSKYPYIGLLVKDATKYSSTKSIIETFCYSLTIIPPSKVPDVSDYLKTGI